MPTDARGTRECPICGFDKPHTHEQYIVEWYRTGSRPGFQDSPMNDNQRHQERLMVEARHEELQRREAFARDPRAFLADLTLLEKTHWIDALLRRLERAEGLPAAQPSAEDARARARKIVTVLAGKGYLRPDPMWGPPIEEATDLVLTEIGVAFAAATEDDLARRAELWRDVWEWLACYAPGRDDLRVMLRGRVLAEMQRLSSPEGAAKEQP